MRDLITSLPAHLGSVVICNWLSLASIVHLDSAYCNRKLRRELLDLFRSVEFIYSHYTGLEDPSMLMWLIMRQAHVQSVVVDFRRDVLVADEYLKFGGSCIQKIELRNALPRDLLIVGAQCRNLRFLAHKIGYFNDSFMVMLRSSPRLVELRLDQMKYHRPWEPKHSLALPHLRLFSMRNSNCSEKLLAKLVGSSPRLEAFDVYKAAGVTFRVLLWMARRCPLLTSLGLRHVHIDDETLAQICTLCPSILRLDLSHNLRITDSGIESVVESLRNLKSINTEGCSRLTEQSYVHLIRRKDTLECLHTDDSFIQEGSILAWCLKQCTKCTTFSIRQRPYYNDYASLSNVLLSSLTHIVTLSVCELNVTDETLSGVALYCHRLRHLNLHHCARFYPEFTRTGLVAVVDNCLDLTLLLAPKTKYYDPAEDENLFVSLRPGLKMITSTENSIFEFDTLTMQLP